MDSKKSVFEVQEVTQEEITKAILEAREEAEALRVRGKLENKRISEAKETIMELAELLAQSRMETKSRDRIIETFNYNRFVFIHALSVPEIDAKRIESIREEIKQIEEARGNFLNQERETQLDLTKAWEDKQKEVYLILAVTYPDLIPPVGFEDWMEDRDIARELALPVTEEATEPSTNDSGDDSTPSEKPKRRK